MSLLPTAIQELTMKNENLRAALKWAWENLATTNQYPQEGAEFDYCVVCGAPEYKHKDNCELILRKTEAEILLNS